MEKNEKMAGQLKPTQPEIDEENSDKKFRTLFETLTDAVMVLKSDRFIDGNSAALAMFGFRTKKELCAKHPSDISPPCQPDGESSQELADRYIRQALAEGTIAFPWVHLRKDGSPFFAHVTLTPLVLDAQPVLLAVVRDVTDEKQALDAVSNERKLLRTVIDNIPDTVYVKDTACRKFIANRADVHNLGKLTEAEVIGENDFDVFPHDIAQAFYHDDQHVMQTGEAVLNREEFLCDGDGNKKWLLTSKIAMKDDAGNVIGLVGIERDITLRKRIEEAFHESEQRYRDMIEQSADGIYIVDIETRKIVQANNAFLMLLGYTDAEVLLLTVYDIIAANKESTDARINRMFTKNEKIVGERLYRKKSGEVLPVRVSVSAITFNGRNALCTMVHDISMQKRREEELRVSEERFRLISENVADCTLLFSSTGECLYASPSLRKLGYDSVMMQNENVFEKIHPNDIRLVKEEIEAVQWSLAHRAIEFQFLAHDASWVMMEATISPMVNDTGSKILMVMRDITERKRNELHLRELLESLKRKNDEIESALNKLKQMQSGLVQSEKLASIGQLTAGIAHEINNPLAFVSSNLNRFDEYYRDLRTLLQSWQTFGNAIASHSEFHDQLHALQEEAANIDLTFIDQDFAELMHHTRDGSARIKRIVDQLRGFSHMASNDFAFANINQALDETLTLVWNEIKYKATVKKIYGEIPIVPCNVGEIKQVFVNLIVNAAHAIADKGEITLQTELVGAVVTIKITDTGSGIAPENLKRIFDPFFTTKAVGKGTGLGLWIVSTIMDKHHGTITADSEVDKGTCFTLTLPIEQRKEGTPPL
jgi:PAS domain S-box-containing protein